MSGFLVFAGRLGLVALRVVPTHNAFIRARNKVDAAGSGINVPFERHHDLVPASSSPSRATPSTRARR